MKLATHSPKKLGQRNSAEESKINSSQVTKGHHCHRCTYSGSRIERQQLPKMSMRNALNRGRLRKACQDGVVDGRDLGFAERGMRKLPTGMPGLVQKLAGPADGLPVATWCHCFGFDS